MQSEHPEDHPVYYKAVNFEVIDIIEAFNLNFSLGNAIKYILRAGKRGNCNYIDDLQKAVWYLNHEIEQETKICNALVF